MDLVDEISLVEKRANELYERFVKGPNTVRRLIAKALYIESPAVVFQFGWLVAKDESGFDRIFATNILAEQNLVEKENNMKYAQNIAKQLRKDYPDLQACYIAIIPGDDDELNIEVEVKPGGNRGHGCHQYTAGENG